MLELFFSAAILGIVIAVMEDDGDFPGWFSLIICILSALIPAAIVNAFLPPYLFFIGLAVGAGIAGCVISALCGMDLKRACIAAGIYFAIRVVISLVFQAMMSA